MKIFFAILFLCISVFPLQARLGDSASVFKNRIISQSFGDVYSQDVVELKLESRDVPYRHYVSAFPEGIEHVIYFKTADGKRARSQDLEVSKKGKLPSPKGWDLHVAFWKGQSVFEAYRRNGPKPNEFEIQGLLLLNKGDSTWNEVQGKQQKETLIGYTHETADGKRRALLKDRMIVVFYTDLDKGMMVVNQKEVKEKSEQAKEGVKDSLEGF